MVASFLAHLKIFSNYMAVNLNSVVGLLNMEYKTKMFSFVRITSSILILAEYRMPQKIMQVAQLSKVDSGLKELGPSVEKLKKDSKNMILRASFGEEELQRGRTKIRDAGKEIQRLVKSIYKIESQAADVIDGLRVIPGRDALKLRAEIAAMTSDLRQQRRDLDRKILKISEHGIPV